MTHRCRPGPGEYWEELTILYWNCCKTYIVFWNKQLHSHVCCKNWRVYRAGNELVLTSIWGRLVMETKKCGFKADIEGLTRYDFLIDGTDMKRYNTWTEYEQHNEMKWVGKAVFSISSLYHSIGTERVLSKSVWNYPSQLWLIFLVLWVFYLRETNGFLFWRFLKLCTLVFLLYLKKKSVITCITGKPLVVGCW